MFYLLYYKRGNAPPLWGGREGYGKMLNLKPIFIYKNRLVSQKSSLLTNFEMKTIFYLLNYKRGNAPLPPYGGKGVGMKNC